MTSLNRSELDRLDELFERPTESFPVRLNAAADAMMNAMMAADQMVAAAHINAAMDHAQNQAMHEAMDHMAHDHAAADHAHAAADHEAHDHAHDLAEIGHDFQAVHAHALEIDEFRPKSAHPTGPLPLERLLELRSESLIRKG